MTVQQTIEEFLAVASKPALVLLGPTASGKTSLSIQVAQQIPGIEIINADSRQLYKYLNIGTAKITTEEMQGVPHHLFDVLDPKQEVSVGWYKRQVYQKITELHNQNKIPLLVGGSMLYISAVVDNFALPVPIDESIRSRVQQEFEVHGAEHMHKKLQKHDPEAAATIHPHNTQHLLRAVEIVYQTGSAKTEVLKDATNDSPFEWLQCGIQRERSDLVERITTRTEQLFTQGWLPEVKDLLQRGYTKYDPGMMSYGYRECIEFIESGSTDLASLKEVIAKKTRAYAKRQMTWWKRDERIHWLHQ